MDTVDGSFSQSLEKILTDRVESLKEEKFSLEFNEDILSHNISMLIASIATKGKRWYVDREVSLFKKRIEKISIDLINEFFGNEIIRVANSVDTKEIKSPRVTQELVKVRWTYFSSLLKDRKFTIKSGWIYTYMTNVVSLVIERYRQGIDRKMKKLWKMLKDENVLRTVLEKYVHIFDDMVIEKTDTVPKPQEIDAIIKLSPLCIKSLDDDVRRGVDVGYESYLILAFYLKFFLSLDGLKRYFYERNPVNSKTFPSVDQYISSIKNMAYMFSYMYGSSGTGTNYNSFACKKIGELDSCPFMSSADIDKVMSYLDASVLEPLDERVRNEILNKISYLSSKKWRSRACGMELCAMMGIGLESKVRINHPIKAYYQKVVEIQEKRSAPALVDHR